MRVRHENRKDRRTAQKVIQAAKQFMGPKPPKGTAITEEEAAVKLNIWLIAGAASLGLIRVYHWPESGESLDALVLEEESLAAFWDRYGANIRAELSSR